MFLPALRSLPRHDDLTAATTALAALDTATQLLAGDAGKQAAELSDEAFEAAAALAAAARDKAAAEDASHILITGHSGAGKSTLAGRLAAAIGWPIYRIDDDPLWRQNEELTDDPQRYTRGADAYYEYRRLRKRLVDRALSFRVPHIVEGAQLLVDLDRLKGHRIVLVDTPEPRVLQQRLQRDRERGKLKGDESNRQERERKARFLWRHLEPLVAEFRQARRVEKVPPDELGDWVARQNKQGRRPTLAIDLDGTLTENDVWKGGDTFHPLRPGARKGMEELRRRGYRLVINTCRGDTHSIRKFLEENDIPFDHINENPDQPPGSSDKMFADAYGDDRAVDAMQPWSHFVEALDTKVISLNRRARRDAD